MWTTRTRSLVIGGGAAVLIAAAGTAGGFAAAHATDDTPAAATSTSTATSTASPGSTGGIGSTDGSGRKHARGDVLTQLKGLQHAEWVVSGKDGAAVSHAAIRGTVTAVSATAITVEAEDGVSQTYAVDSSTTVTLRGPKGGSTGGATGTATTGTPTSGATAGATTGGAKGGARGSITDVTTGAEVLVTGTGDPLTAERVLLPRG